MSDTPRTDTAVICHQPGIEHHELVRADFARALEREITALRDALDYVDRQVREVWEPRGTYEQVHHAWCVEVAAKALKGVPDDPFRYVPLPGWKS